MTAGPRAALKDVKLRSPCCRALRGSRQASSYTAWWPPAAPHPQLLAFHLLGITHQSPGRQTGLWGHVSLSPGGGDTRSAQPGHVPRCSWTRGEGSQPFSSHVEDGPRGGRQPGPALGRPPATRQLTRLSDVASLRRHSSHERAAEDHGHWKRWAAVQCDPAKQDQDPAPRPSPLGDPVDAGSLPPHDPPPAPAALSLGVLWGQSSQGPHVGRTTGLGPAFHPRQATVGKTPVCHPLGGTALRHTHKVPRHHSGHLLLPTPFLTTPLPVPPGITPKINDLNSDFCLRSASE